MTLKFFTDFAGVPKNRGHLICIFLFLKWWPFLVTGWKSSQPIRNRENFDCSKIAILVDFLQLVELGAQTWHVFALEKCSLKPVILHTYTFLVFQFCLVDLAVEESPRFQTWLLIFHFRLWCRSKNWILSNKNEKWRFLNKLGPTILGWKFPN